METKSLLYRVFILVLLCDYHVLPVYPLCHKILYLWCVLHWFIQYSEVIYSAYTFFLLFYNTQIMNKSVFNCMYADVNMEDNCDTKRNLLLYNSYTKYHAVKVQWPPGKIDKSYTNSDVWLVQCSTSIIWRLLQLCEDCQVHGWFLSNLAPQSKLVLCAMEMQCIISFLFWKNCDHHWSQNSQRVGMDLLDIKMYMCTTFLF